MAQEESKKDQFMAEVRRVVQEEVQAAISQAVVPKGYERCAVCGEVVKSNQPCPYCEKSKSSQKDDDIFSELGI